MAAHNESVFGVFKEGVYWLLGLFTKTCTQRNNGTQIMEFIDINYLEMYSLEMYSNTEDNKPYGLFDGEWQNHFMTEVGGMSTVVDG